MFVIRRGHKRSRPVDVVHRRKLDNAIPWPIQGRRRYLQHEEYSYCIYGRTLFGSSLLPLKLLPLIILLIPRRVKVPFIFYPMHRSTLVPGRFKVVSSEKPGNLLSLFGY
jgi:hypothetical protein